MRRAAFIIAAILLLLAGAALTGHRLRSIRGHESGTALLRLSGALRVFIVDALWIRMQGHLEEGRESQVLSDARTLLSLVPDNTRIREFLHWHLAFNMSRKAVTPASRAEWIREGLEIMEEGLARDPDSHELNFALGKTFFFEPGGRITFADLCMERYGLLPVQLAPLYLEKAHLAGADQEPLLFLVNALIRAAYFEMERKAYGSAASRWGKVLLYLTPWIDNMDMDKEEDREELKRYYRDLHAYCSLMDGADRGETLGVEDRKRIEELSRSIRENRFSDLEDDDED